MKILISILLISLFAASAKGQESNNRFKYAIAMNPQYAIVNTMRMDFDLLLEDKNVVTVSPMFSFARNSSLLFSNNYSYYDYGYENPYPQNVSLVGGGIKGMLRHFFGDFEYNTGVYAGAGLHYRYSLVEYDIRGWVDDVERGMPVITYGMNEKERHIYQGGIDILFGYQMYLVDNLFMDAYAGWGFRLSNVASDDEADDYWGETIFDLGYSGYTPLIGLRLGMFFK